MAGDGTGPKSGSRQMVKRVLLPGLLIFTVLVSAAAKPNALDA
jgi:hypothetical protein